MEMSAISYRQAADMRDISIEMSSVLSDFSKASSQRTTIHILDSNAVDRARSFRMFSELDYHCEIYSTLVELMSFRPASGIVLVHERPGSGCITEVLKQTREAGLALTVVGCAHNPSIDMVVTAMAAGARQFFEMPFNPQKVVPALKALVEINKAEQQANELRAKAALSVRNLSTRERQVMELLVNGNSNKAIARLLEISPRTVEIHRMKAMAKLGAQSAGDAVRIWMIGTAQYPVGFSPTA